VRALPAEIQHTAYLPLPQFQGGNAPYPGASGWTLTACQALAGMAGYPWHSKAPAAISEPQALWKGALTLVLAGLRAVGRLTVPDKLRPLLPVGLAQAGDALARGTSLSAQLIPERVLALLRLAHAGLNAPGDARLPLTFVPVRRYALPARLAGSPAPQPGACELA
jgi:hypothetical protein